MNDVNALNAFTIVDKPSMLESKYLSLLNALKNLANDKCIVLSVDECAKLYGHQVPSKLRNGIMIAIKKFKLGFRVGVVRNNEKIYIFTRS